MVPVADPVEAVRAVRRGDGGGGVRLSGAESELSRQKQLAGADGCPADRQAFDDVPGVAAPQQAHCPCFSGAETSATGECDLRDGAVMTGAAFADFA